VLCSNHNHKYLVPPIYKQPCTISLAHRSTADLNSLLLFQPVSAMATTRDGGTVRTVLLPALQKLNWELTKMFENGENNFEAMKSDHLEEFVNVDCEVGLRALAQMFSFYVNCMKEVGVKTRAELEELWKDCYHHEEVRECVEELLTLEESIQEFFDEIDREIEQVEDWLAVNSVTNLGKLLPANLSLKECKSGELVQLKNVWKQSKFALFVPLKFYF